MSFQFNSQMLDQQSDLETFKVCVTDSSTRVKGSIHAQNATRVYGFSKKILEYNQDPVTNFATQ